MKESPDPRRLRRARHPGAVRSRTLAPAIAALVLAGCIAFDSPEPATPQRPTISSDTATTAVGTVEIEAGADYDPRGPFVVPVTVKFGAGDATELYATWLPWRRRDTGTGSEDGIGDLAFGARHRLLDQDGARPSFALQGSTKLPVADVDRGLSSGETDVFLAAMATWGIGDWAVNAYYEAGFLGDPDGPGLDIAHVPALAGGVHVGDGLSVFGEIAGVLVPESDTESGFATFGIAWTYEPQSVFDIGARAGFGDDAPDVVMFIGVTHNFGTPK